MKSTSPRTAAARLVAALIVCATAGGAVQAEPASLAGPSIAQANKLAAFNGTNFTPNSAVTVMITSPSGLEAGFSAVIDAKGQLLYEFTPTEDGMYALRVVAGKSQVLATANVFARR